MPMTVEQITHEAIALPLTSRAELAERLMVSVGDEMEPELEKLWAEEANRRFEELVSGRVQGVPLADALAAGRRALDE